MVLVAPFLISLAAMIVVMGAAWVTQRAAGNAGWVDVFWTFGTGAVCVLAVFLPPDAHNTSRQLLVSALSAIWALRLGVFIAIRVSKTNEDARYAELRQEWGSKFQANMVWTVLVQAPASALLALTVFSAAHWGDPALGTRDLAGALILLVAIAGEGLADDQMRRFKRTAAHGSVMDKGLWGWSRHPNYFFEWLGWLAYPVIAFDPSTPETWTTWIAPVVMFIVLRFGTGVPVLEKVMLKSRGDAFRAYQSRVSAFFPLPPRRTPT